MVQNRYNFKGIELFFIMRKLSAAVIIGRPIDDGMNSPFDLKCFKELESLGLLHIVYCPVEVAYPDSLTRLEALARGPSDHIVREPYVEGVLVNISRINYEGEAGETNEVDAIKSYVATNLSEAGRQIEVYENNDQKFKSGLLSAHIVDFHTMHQIHEASNPSKYALFQILGVYPSEEEKMRYGKIALPLLNRTRTARILRYTSQQNLKSQNQSDLVTKFSKEIRK